MTSTLAFFFWRIINSRVASTKSNSLMYAAVSFSALSWTTLERNHVLLCCDRPMEDNVTWRHQLSPLALGVIGLISSIIFICQALFVYLLGCFSGFWYWITSLVMFDQLITTPSSEHWLYVFELFFWLNQDISRCGTNVEELVLEIHPTPLQPNSCVEFGIRFSH